MLKTILLIIIALCYIVLRLYLRKRFVKNRTLSDEECLVSLTLKRSVSVYEIFHVAGKSWNQSESKIEDNFKYYLKSVDLTGNIFRKKPYPQVGTIFKISDQCPDGWH